MNKKNIRNYQIFSIVFAFIIGTLLHFTYKWSEGNPFVASFSAINESVWEHLKLLFFPMVISTIIGAFYFRKTNPNFLCSKVLGIITSIIFMVIFFYTYTGVIGTNFALVDIASFFVITLLGEFISYALIVNNYQCNKKISIIILTILLISFIVFTYFTPDFGIFKDPVTGKYGITNGQ